MQKRLMPMVCAWMLFGCLATLGLSQQSAEPFSKLMHLQSWQVPGLDNFRTHKLWSRGGCTAWATEYGDLIEYVPSELADNPRLVVIAHGSIPTDDEALDAARMHIMRSRWHRFADRNDCILVAPAFDRSRYGGYRYLEGDGVDADEFVLEIAREYAQIFDMPDSQFYLYGHSAGGQFAHRFLVTHPDRLLGAAISAPGNYANAAGNICWPYGIRSAPNPVGFVKSARVPATVVVGTLDLKPGGMGGVKQFGHNRLQRARNWVRSMRDLTNRVGVETHLKLAVVPGVGHSSRGLLDRCIGEFNRIFEHPEQPQQRSVKRVDRP